MPLRDFPSIKSPAIQHVGESLCQMQRAACSCAAAMAIVLIAGLAAGAPQEGQSAQKIEGDWQGVLRAGKNELHLMVHITRDSHGFLSATMDSVDEGAMGIPINDISFENSKLNFSADSIGGSYEGQANSDLTSISGSWAQAGNTLPLNLKRAAPAAKPEQKPGN